MTAIVAIAEDEDDLRSILVEYLTDAGFEVIAAGSGPELRTLIAERPIDIAVLDVIMPGEDGLSLARWLRGRGPVGIIMATAQGRPIDRIVGLEMGADDYLVKPYELRELLARIRSVLRRIGTPSQAALKDAPEAAAKTIRFGDFTLDPARRTLVHQANGVVNLTPAEFDLLEALASRPGRVLSRAQLIELCSEQESDNDRAMDVRVTRLRKKIEETPESPRFLKTVRGEGYLFTPKG